MVWRTNFDKCFSELGATVAVAGDMTAATEEAVQQKMTQLRCGQQQTPAIKPQKTHKHNVPIDKLANGTTNFAENRSNIGGQPHLQGSNLIPASPSQQQSSQLLNDGSHAAYESLSLNAADMSEDLANTLQHIVGQLDMLTQVRAWMTVFGLQLK